MPSCMINGTQPADAASYALVEKPNPAAATQNFDEHIFVKYVSLFASCPSFTTILGVLRCAL